jgi:hypothetical protein
MRPRWEPLAAHLPATLAFGPPAVPPAVPIGASMVANSTDSITLAWERMPADDATGWLPG